MRRAESHSFLAEDLLCARRCPRKRDGSGGHNWPSPYSDGTYLLEGSRILQIQQAGSNGTDHIRRSRVLGRRREGEGSHRAPASGQQARDGGGGRWFRPGTGGAFPWKQKEGTFPVQCGQLRLGGTWALGPFKEMCKSQCCVRAGEKTHFVE